MHIIQLTYLCEMKYCEKTKSYRKPTHNKYRRKRNINYISV